MSQENLARVREALTAYNRGGMDGLFEYYDDDVVFAIDPGFPDAGTYRGKEAVRAYSDQWAETFEENVEIVRSTLDAFAAGNPDRMLAFVAPEVVIDASRRILNPATYVGIEGIRQMLADMDETWEGLRIEQREFIDAGDRVAVIGRLVGKGKGSGIEVGRPIN